MDSSVRERDALWRALGGADAAAAHRAVWTLVAAGEATVPDLQRRLAAEHGSDARQLAPLLADLGSAQFDVRQRATEGLEKLGDVALPALRRMLDERPALEARQRAQRLLERLAGSTPSVGRLRVVRATEVLEQIDAPASRQALQALAASDPATWLGQEARAARDRLARRAARQQ